MEEGVRALQQQVYVLMSQNVVLEVQLISQLKIAQGFAQLSGAITTVESIHKHRRKRCLSIKKVLENRQYSLTEKNIFMRTKNVEISSLCSFRGNFAFVVRRGRSNSWMACLNSELRRPQRWKTGFRCVVHLHGR